MPEDDIAKAWKSFSPERRDALLGKMTPEQKKKLRATLEAGTAPVTPEAKTPGFFKRLSQGLGIPTSMEEAKGMVLPSKKTAFLPPFAAAPLLARYVESLYGEGKKAAKETGEAATNIREGGPVGANIGKAAAGGTEFLLRGVLGPVGGGTVQAWGEDVHTGNYTGAGGDALAVLINGLLLKGATKPTTKVRANKVSYAADVPETMQAGKQVRSILPDLDKAAATTGAPKTVGELLSNVKEAKNRMNTESGLAMQPLRGKQFVPTAISDAIKSKITPDMEMTPQGRQMAQALKNAAVNYDKPWTYEQLDAARMNANARLRSFYRQAPTGQYANLRTDVGQIVDRAVVSGVQDIVYPAMDQAAGKPPGYFASLKQRQGTLIQLEEALDKNAKALETRTAKIAGSPRFSTENVSAYGHPATTPGISIHRLQNIVLRPNPLAQANRAVGRAFAGRPIPQAAIASLPVRMLLLPPELDQEPIPPITNRAEALQSLGR